MQGGSKNDNIPRADLTHPKAMNECSAGKPFDIVILGVTASYRTHNFSELSILHLPKEIPSKTLTQEVALWASMAFSSVLLGNDQD
jgi:hypothetical protein